MSASDHLGSDKKEIGIFKGESHPVLGTCSRLEHVCWSSLSILGPWPALIRHPTLRRLKLGEMDPVPNKGQAFMIERKVDFFTYNSAVKARDLPWVKPVWKLDEYFSLKVGWLYSRWQQRTTWPARVQSPKSEGSFADSLHPLVIILLSKQREGAVVPSEVTVRYTWHLHSHWCLGRNVG